MDDDDDMPPHDKTQEVPSSQVMPCSQMDPADVADTEVDKSPAPSTSPFTGSQKGGDLWDCPGLRRAVVYDRLLDPNSETMVITSDDDVEMPDVEKPDLGPRQPDIPVPEDTHHLSCMGTGSMMT